MSANSFLMTAADYPSENNVITETNFSMRKQVTGKVHEDTLFLTQKEFGPVLSNESLRNVFMILALLLFFGNSIDMLTLQDDLPLQASFGRMIAATGTVVCALLAHRGYKTCAFMMFSAMYVFGLMNAAFIAGFGISSPAMVVGLLPVLIALGLFERNKAWLWCMPVFAAWLLVVVVQFGMPALFVAYASSQGQPPKPSEFAWLFSCLITIIPAVTLTLASRKRGEQLLENERKLRNDTLEMLASQRKWNDERDEFMGRVSHELRTPLAAMRYSLTLAKHPKANEAAREKYLNTLDTSISDLLNLLNEVLDAFKYGRAGFSLGKIDFEIRELITEVDVLFSDLAAQKGLKLTVDLDMSGSERVTGDPARLKQMLSNLILNAIKFTREGEIKVRVHRIQNEISTWRFEVLDTGCGVSDEDQSRLFKPFFQSDSAQSDSGLPIKGTGLGLSIVYQLVQAMGGRVGVISQLGHGSTFWFEVALTASVDAGSLSV